MAHKDTSLASVSCNPLSLSKGAGRREGSSAFTLVELLVVITILLALAGIMTPWISSSLEKGRAAKVHAELRQLEMGLEMYNDDHGKYPPVRYSCNTAQRDHWYELPSELVRAGYLPKGKDTDISSGMEDPFNPGHTYKYVAPGPFYMNNDYNKEGHSVFIPDDFPVCASATGYDESSDRGVLAWAVWSLGPRQQQSKALSGRAPISGETWYRKTGDHGVLACIKPRHGASFHTP